MEGREEAVEETSLATMESIVEEDEELPKKRASFEDKRRVSEAGSSVEETVATKSISGDKQELTGQGRSPAESVESERGERKFDVEEVLKRLLSSLPDMIGYSNVNVEVETSAVELRNEVPFILPRLPRIAEATVNRASGPITALLEVDVPFILSNLVIKVAEVVNVEKSIEGVIFDVGDISLDVDIGVSAGELYEDEEILPKKLFEAFSPAFSHAHGIVFVDITEKPVAEYVVMRILKEAGYKKEYSQTGVAYLSIYEPIVIREKGFDSDREKKKSFTRFSSQR